MKRTIVVLFCVLLLAFADEDSSEAEVEKAPLESSLEKDSSNPGGLTEAVVLLQRESDITKFAKLFKRLPKDKTKPAAQVDNRNYCNPIKQQSESSAATDVGCGSCTTFAVIAAAEVAYNVATKEQKVFSEMDLVDCMYHAGGCNGNVVQHAIMHVFNNGVATEKEYPYEPHDKKVCDPKPTRYHKNKFVPFKIDQKNDAHWKVFLQQYGAFALQYYSGGFDKVTSSDDLSTVIVDYCNGSEKNTQSINHAVSVVGYGKTNETEYFLVRNSWGVGAGKHDKGYFRLKVGACNSQSKEFFGFVFDTCEDQKDKKTCVAKAECSWNGITKKCKSAFKKWTTGALNVAAKVVEKIDNAVDKINGIGMNDLPVGHVMRKNNTELFCFFKVANKIKNQKTVDEWFDKCVKAKAVRKSDGKILSYANLKKTLGIKKKVTTILATKGKDNAPSQGNRTNWYSLLDDFVGLQIGSGIRKKYWDPRFNRDDFDDIHLVLGKSTEGKFQWASETAGGFGWDGLTQPEKGKISEELVCYARATDKRERNDLIPLIEGLDAKVYKGKKILDYTGLRSAMGVKVARTYACGENGKNGWYLKENSGKFWNCKTNAFESLPEGCEAFKTGSSDSEAEPEAASDAKEPEKKKNVIQKIGDIFKKK